MEISRVLGLNASVNLVLTLLKIGVGIIGQSGLLVADGLHSASDLLTDLFSVIGIRLSKKDIDEGHPFGHGNLEYAFGLIVSMIIAIMVYSLTKDLILNWNEISSEVSILLISVSIMTFVVKWLISMFVLKKAKELDSMTLKNSGLESKTDAYSTIIVIMGLVLTDIGIRQNIFWLTYSEKIATVFVIFMLIKAAKEIFREALIGIAGTKADNEVTERYWGKIRDLGNSHGEIDRVLVLKSGIHYSVLVHVKFFQLTTLSEADQVIKLIKQNLFKDKQINKVAVDFDIKIE